MSGTRRREEAPAEDRLVVAELGPPHGVKGEIMGRLSGVSVDELLSIPRLWLRLWLSERPRRSRTTPMLSKYSLTLACCGPKTVPNQIVGRSPL